MAVGWPLCEDQMMVLCQAMAITLVVTPYLLNAFVTFARWIMSRRGLAGHWPICITLCPLLNHIGFYFCLPHALTSLLRGVGHIYPKTAAHFTQILGSPQRRASWEGIYPIPKKQLPDTLRFPAERLLLMQLVDHCEDSARRRHLLCLRHQLFCTCAHVSLLS